MNIFINPQKNNINKSELSYKKAREIWPSDKHYFNYSDLYPLKLYPFGDFKVYGPSNPYNYLISVFGKNWNKCAITSNYNHKQEHPIYNYKFTLTEDMKTPLFIKTKDNII